MIKYNLVNVAQTLMWLNLAAQIGSRFSAMCAYMHVCV